MKTMHIERDSSSRKKIIIYTFLELHVLLLYISLCSIVLVPIFVHMLMISSFFFLLDVVEVSFPPIICCILANTLTHYRLIFT